MTSSSPLTLQAFDFITGDKAVPVDYQQAYTAMRRFTRDHVTQSARANDQLWVLEHTPVFTQGQAGKPEHVIGDLPAPLVETDRGGQVTYHGPGQIMGYLLADLRRLELNVRTLVQALENAVIQMLAQYDIVAVADRKAPGVYVRGEKIAALGLRVKQGRCYHGLCFNYDFDASAFQAINPCGYEGMQVTQLADLLSPLPQKTDIVAKLVTCLSECLGYDGVEISQQDWASKILREAETPG